MALLGHSWGGLVAMEYAVRHPDRLSHLVLMDTAPACHADWLMFREQLRHRRPPGDLESMAAVASSDAYRSGDLEAAAAIPGARLSILRDCGHFAYLERPGEVHREVTEFLG